MIKVYRIIAMIVFLSAFTSCEDFLEEDPVDRFVVENFYKSADDANAAVVGVYNKMFNIYERDMTILNDLPTDTEKNGLGMPNQFLQNLEYLRFTPENQFTTAMWRHNYEGIARANTTISRLPEVDMDENLKSQFIGETRFLRGLYYFNLVRFFGDVPLVLVIEAPQDAMIPRTDKELVYDQIIEDLQFAENNLPVTAEAGRATKGAAIVLLGKVYLEKKDFPNAITKLGDVIEGTENFGYALHDNFRDNWQQETENGKETILTVEFMDPPGNANNQMQLNAPKYSIHNGGGVPGHIGANEADIPTVDLFNSYLEEDERKDWTFKQDYVSPTTGETFTATIPIFGKYWEEGEIVMNRSSTNVHVLRYADALLMYAEALNGAGDTPKALNYLNMVRERAFNSDSFNYVGLDKEAAGDAILEERKLEFAYEGSRWFDLVRAGKLFETMKAHGTLEAELAESNKTEITANARPAHSLYPIPQREMDLNPELIQNPGY